MSIDRLKKIPPINNPAPDIRKGDELWSDIFERAARSFDKREAESGLCLEVSELLGVGASYKTTGHRQADRMTRYISEILGGTSMFVRDWLCRVNGKHHAPIDLYEYRAAWARHLAAQFRAKGL